MEHLLEVLKILDGAVNADRAKVTSYAEQLASKLDAAGDGKAADRIRRTIRGGRTTQLSTARVSPSLPVDGESRFALADEHLYGTDDVRVFLDAGIESRVREFVSYVQASDRLIANGVGIAPSLLVHGPPGVGKSELAKLISAQLELPLLTARTDTLVSSYLGNTSKNLRALFEHAMARPCVLFLDEFDALAKLRDDQHELGELKRVVVGLLQNIDALDSKTILLAATNHEHLLDAAIWRRFAFRLRIGLPDTVVREHMFEHFLGARRPVALTTEALAALGEGLSGADIKSVCDDARREAVLAEREQVSEGGLVLRLARARMAELDTMQLSERLVALRNLNPRIFTVRRLAGLFDVSVGKVSMLTRKGNQ